jgi:Tfp pilus assembly protein PilO
MTARKHTLIWTGGIVAVTVGFLSLVTGPQIGRIQSAMADIDAEQHDQEVADETSVRIKVLEREVAELQSGTAAFNDQIPVGEHLGTFLQDLGQFAEQRQVRLEEIEPGSALQSDKLIALPITLSVHGPIKQVFGWIQDVERMPRLTLVERIETIADQKMPGQVTAQLRMRVYYRASS